MILQDINGEKELLQRIALGDEEAFVKVFRHYQDPVFKVVYSYLKSTALSEEVLQDIFLKVWQKRETLADLDSFKNWLFIVSRNYLVNYLQKLAKDKAMREQWITEQPIYENSTDYRLREKHLATYLQEIINRLPQQQRLVFQLAKEQFLTYAEIAEELGISPGTVRIHMSRALGNIREELKQHGMEYLLLYIVTYPILK